MTHILLPFFSPFLGMQRFAGPLGRQSSACSCRDSSGSLDAGGLEKGGMWSWCLFPFLNRVVSLRLIQKLVDGVPFLGINAHNVVCKLLAFAGFILGLIFFLIEIGEAFG